MAEQLIFQCFYRSTAADGAVLDAGRPKKSLPLTLKETQGGRSEALPIEFKLMGPGDAAGLKPGAVRRTYPANGAFNVETNKLPYIEFTADDLPWRYSPDANGDTMRSWLMLVVGTSDEVTLLPGNRVSFTQSAITAHASVPHHRLAHRQVHNDQTLSRLFSPRILEPSNAYVAVVVPAFNADATPLTLVANTPVPAYYAWHFSTSDFDGSFDKLANRLWAINPKPPNIGIAPVAYQTTDAQPTLQPQMLMGGALVGLNALPDAPVPDEIDTHFQWIRPKAETQNKDEDGRPIVQLPRYGEPWLPALNAAEPAWMRELNDDPRMRGAAGLGAWAGIAWQERIVEAASKIYGAFWIASMRIRQLNAGLAATRSLWDRRLPLEPHHKLMVLGMAMSRMVTPQGHRVIDQVTSPDRPLPPAAFSSAARRMLRPGTVHGKLAQPGALNPGALLTRLNTCPPDRKDQPAGLPHVGVLTDDRFDDMVGKLLEHQDGFNISGVVREDAEQLNRIEQNEMADAGLQPDESWREATLQLGEDRDLQRNTLVDLLAPAVTRECEHRSVDLGKLSDVIAGAFNPHGDDAFIVQRVLRTIDGLDDQPLTPPELCLDLEIPAWKFLNEFCKDWFLPGLADVQFNLLDANGQPKRDADGKPIRDPEKDPVIAAQMRERFTDAFLVGLNQQTLNELRWRNLHVATGCTPLRRFWEPIDSTTMQAGPDIVGIHLWGNTPLGDDSHETPAARGDNLVLIFKSQLWRRYPETLIYLLPGAPHVEGEADKPDWTKPHIEPSLHVEVERDVVAFGFPKPPGILDDHWVIIEQVPRGITFYNTKYQPLPPDPDPDLDPVTTSAGFAKHQFAPAVRVLIEGTEFIR